MQPVLLDTCAALWIADDAAISAAAADALDRAASAGATTYVSPITAWEIGQLVARRRLQLLMTPEKWFRRLVEVVRLAEMPPELLIASSSLPGSPPRDPADRIIVATARDLGATLITRDRALLTYGEEGHVSVLAC